MNPDTGALVWHFQHFPNDQWDLDWAFERQILDLPVERHDAPRRADGRQDRHLRRRRRAHGRVRVLARPRLEQHRHRDRHAHRREARRPQPLSRRHACSSSARTARARRISCRPRTSQRAASIVVPLNEACMDLFPVPGGGTRRAIVGRQLGHPAAARRRRQLRPPASDRPRDARNGVDGAATRAANVGRARDGRRARVRGRVRPRLSRVRRAQRPAACGRRA